MIDYSILIAALIAVESSGNDQALGDGGRSVGCLQISMAVIQDVNRIYNMHFTAFDRYNRRKSIQICKLYLLHWANHYRKKTQRSETAEVLARIWNGGPSGWRKNATKSYWNKVEEQLHAKHIL